MGEVLSFQEGISSDHSCGCEGEAAGGVPIKSYWEGEGSTYMEGANYESGKVLIGVVLV